MDQADPGNTEFVLPIICTHCHKEINLAMGFALLPPDENQNYDNTTEDTTK